jgi:hypothetical protein
MSLDVSVPVHGDFLGFFSCTYMVGNILVCTHFGLVVAKSFLAITVGQYPAAIKFLARLYTYISVRGSCEDFKMGEGGCGDFCWMSRGRMSTGHGVPYHP